MAYPKPLSEKSIVRMYADSKLTQEKIDFLRNFFDSCAALYGSICLNDMREVYKELSEKIEVAKIQRKDFIEFSSIIRLYVVKFMITAFMKSMNFIWQKNVQIFIAMLFLQR